MHHRFICLVLATSTACWLGCASSGDQPANDGGVAPPASTGQTGTGGTGLTGQPPPGTGTGTGGQPTGSGDNGALFRDAGSAAAILADAKGPSSAPADASAGQSETGSGIPGDGHMATAHIGGFTAVFTQKGTDVTLVLSGNCSGSHKIEIHEGYACDDPTKGPVWGGPRGTGLFSAGSTFTCDGTNKPTYTRSGADPKTNWTVADHNATTDVTLHPILVDNSCGTFF
jgi:hypothetical protein